MRTHRAAGADHALELLKDRRRQRAAAVVDDRDRFGGNAVGQKFEHAIARSDVTRDADQVLRIFDDVVADPALLAAVRVRRRDDRLGMFEAEGLEVFADAGRRLIDVRPFAHRDHRRPVEPMAGRAASSRWARSPWRRPVHRICRKRNSPSRRRPRRGGVGQSP